MARRRPAALSPGVLIRRGALYKGVLGSSPVWRAVAVVVFGRSLLKRVFGKQPEIISTETLRPGQTVSIRALPQKTRADRQRYRRTSRPSGGS